MEHHNEQGFTNVGTGSDITIAELAALIGSITGFEGRLVFDRSKPDGTMEKGLDVSKIHAAGWHHRISLEEGLRDVWELVRTTVFQ